MITIRQIIAVPSRGMASSELDLGEARTMWKPPARPLQPSLSSVRRTSVLECAVRAVGFWLDEKAGRHWSPAAAQWQFGRVRDVQHVCLVESLEHREYLVRRPVHAGRPERLSWRHRQRARLEKSVQCLTRQMRRYVPCARPCWHRNLRRLYVFGASSWIRYAYCRSNRSVICVLLEKHPLELGFLVARFPQKKLRPSPASRKCLPSGSRGHCGAGQSGRALNAPLPCRVAKRAVEDRQRSRACPRPAQRQPRTDTERELRPRAGEGAPTHALSSATAGWWFSLPPDAGRSETRKYSAHPRRGVGCCAWSLIMHACRSARTPRSEEARQGGAPRADHSEQAAN